MAADLEQAASWEAEAAREEALQLDGGSEIGAGQDPHHVEQAEAAARLLGEVEAAAEAAAEQARALQASSEAQRAATAQLEELRAAEEAAQQGQAAAEATAAAVQEQGRALAARRIRLQHELGAAESTAATARYGKAGSDGWLFAAIARCSCGVALLPLPAAGDSL